VTSFDLSQDFFSYFDLARSYTIERNLLEQRYLDRSRQFHPDRVMHLSEHDKRIAMERSSAINKAYQTLRDPLKRAEYLLLLEGIDLNSSEPKSGAPVPNQAFLLAMLELREELEQAQKTGLTAVEALRESVQVQAVEHMDQAILALEAGSIAQAAQALVAHRYLTRFLAEVDHLDTANE